MEAEEEDGELECARVERNNKINVYKEALKASSREDQDEAFSEMASAMTKYAVMEEKEDGNLGDALADMTVKVLTYRKTLDSCRAQKGTFLKGVGRLRGPQKLINECGQLPRSPATL